MKNHSKVAKNKMKLGFLKKNPEIAMRYINSLNSYPALQNHKCIKVEVLLFLRKNATILIVLKEFKTTMLYFLATLNLAKIALANTSINF